MEAARATRETSQRGQALIVALGAMFVVLLGAGVLLGGALAQKGRLQRATDLAALSAARGMRDDFARLFEPPVIGGRLNPRHLARADYLARARGAVLQAGRHNGLDLEFGDVSFPGGGSGAPVRVKVKVKDRLPARGGDVPVEATATATAELAPPTGDPLPLEASGTGYTGPLAYRQGKPSHSCRRGYVPIKRVATHRVEIRGCNSRGSPLERRLSRLCDRRRDDRPKQPRRWPVST